MPAYPLSAVDRATLAYTAVALLFTALYGPRTFPALALLPLGLLLAAVLAGVLAPRARRSGPAGRLLAEFYPLALAIALYAHVGLVNTARGVSHDALVQRWEQSVFGCQPSTVWIRAFPSPAWSTLLHAAYLSYYAILAVSPLGLWLSGRRATARGTLLAMMVAFYLCYAAFFAFPVAGPRYVLPAVWNAATGVPLARLTHRLLEGGSAWGTAFPSSHVAVALVAAVCAWRGWRPLGAVLVPVAVLLTLATVYGQLHYGVDALAGVVVAALVLCWHARRTRGTFAAADR